MSNSRRILVFFIFILGLCLSYIFPKQLVSMLGDLIKGKKFQIVDIHEHIESFEQAVPFLRAMDENSIKKTVLVASPDYTLYLRSYMGFENYHRNNQEVLRIAESFPDRFDALVTLNPLDENNLEKLKFYLKRGAKGLKLYYGHAGSHGKGPFHSVPLDYPGMLPVFEYCQRNNVPILFHINMNKYYQEFLRLMKRFPKN